MSSTSSPPTAEVEVLRLVFVAGAAFRPLAIEGAVRPLVAGGIDLASVEALALGGVREEIVGGVDRLELRLGLFLPGVEVGVVLLGELAVGLAELLLRDVALHAENGVRVVGRHGSYVLAFRRRSKAGANRREPPRIMVDERSFSVLGSVGTEEEQE
jgi:hypothetical protein